MQPFVLATVLHFAHVSILLMLMVSLVHTPFKEATVSFNGSVVRIFSPLQILHISLLGIPVILLPYWIPLNMTHSAMVAREPLLAHHLVLHFAAYLPFSPTYTAIHRRFLRPSSQAPV